MERGPYPPGSGPNSFGSDEGPALGNNKIFLIDDHTAKPDSIRKPWNKAVKAVGTLTQFQF